MTQTLTQKSMLARLLAKENIEVVQGNYPTAYFDVENRVLGLPTFKDVSKDLYDLLVGHEVGHALFTPADGWHDSAKEVPGIPRSFINIIEDIRIEKKILREYPGLIGGFKRGYQDLLDRDFFGIDNEDVSELSFMDRLNLFSKSRGLVDVSFTEEEQPFVDMSMKVETWEDVISTCESLCEWLGVEAPSEEEETETVEIEIPVSVMPGDDDQDQEEQQGEDSDGQDEQNESEDAQSMGSSQDGESEKAEEQTDSASPSQEQPEDGNDRVEKPVTGGKEDKGSKTESNPAVVKTDETFRENEKTLVENLSEEGSNLLVKGMDREMFNRTKVSFETQVAARQVYSDKGFRGADFPQAKYDAWLKDSKAQVNLLVKEFEMRKAAYRTLRAKTSQKGSLDVTKLHKYKYDDNLFKQVTNLADSKSHGMIMFIDFSGSMARCIESVLRQTLILSQFCARVGIPYEVYGFTDSSGNTARFQRDYIASNPNTMINCDSQLTELLSSRMTKQQKEDATKFMFNIWRQMYYQPTEFDSMRSTPLNETYMAAHFVCEDFQKRYNVQKLNVTFLTDGYGDRLYIKDGEDIKAYQEGWLSFSDKKKRSNQTIIDFRGKQMKIDLSHWDYGKNPIGPQQVLLKSLKEEFNCSLVHYFVVDSASEFRSQINQLVGYDKGPDAIKNARKAGAFTIDNNYGYDRRILIESRGDVLRYRKDGEGNLEVDTSMTATQIASAFKKQAGSKNKKRFISQKFAEMVA